MPLLHRRSDETDEPTVDAAPPAEEAREAEPAAERPARRGWRRTVTVPVTVPERSIKRTVRVPSRSVERTVAAPGVSLGPLAAVVAGVLLAAAGVVALVRTGIDDTWFRPRAEVLEAGHTALLGVLELGAGVLLLAVGLLRWRVAVAVLGLAMAMACSAMAAAPGEVARELAVERWWAWLLAGAGAVLTLAAMHAPRERQRQRTVLEV